MNQFKKLLSVLLILTLVLSAFTACGKEEIAEVTEAVPTQTQETAETQAPEETVVSNGYYQVGDKMEDFSVTTYDGREVSLYQVLEEKDMVLLNLWASWCGPCGSEFPAMQEAYEKYQDKVEIIALSTEPGDTDEVLAAYAQEKGMTFSVGKDNGISSRFDFMYIPTSIVIDRFGTICLQESNAMPDPAIFENLFDVYTAEDYTESVFMPSMLSEKPDVEAADAEKLGEALNAEGGNLVFANSGNPFHWPMTVEKVDGRDVVAASNARSAYSLSAVKTQVDVQAGDVLLVEYKLASEFYSNVMYVEVNGNSVKKSARSCDWNTYAYQFEKAGTYDVAIGLDLVTFYSPDANGLWIDSIQVVSGDEAVKALAANPQYPVAEVSELKVLNESARAAYLYDANEPDAKEYFMICSDEKLELLVTLDETVDPENASVQNYAGVQEPLISHVTEDGYRLEVSNVTEQAMLGFVSLCSDGAAVAQIPVFYSAELATAYVDSFNQSSESSIEWVYDESAPAGNVTYTVAYVDQNGDPVPGVVCQVCDESMCQVFTSDANGVCKITLPAKAYEIHTLKVPEGYEGDTTTVTEAPAGGGELSFTLTKK